MFLPLFLCRLESVLLAKYLMKQNGFCHNIQEVINGCSASPTSALFKMATTAFVFSVIKIKQINQTDLVCLKLFFPPVATAYFFPEINILKDYGFNFSQSSEHLYFCHPVVGQLCLHHFSLQITLSCRETLVTTATVEINTFQTSFESPTSCFLSGPESLQKSNQNPIYSTVLPKKSLIFLGTRLALMTTSIHCGICFILCLNIQFISKFPIFLKRYFINN